MNLSALLLVPFLLGSDNEGPGCARAEYLSPATVTARAVAVVQGEIINIRPVLYSDHVYTDYTLAVRNIWKGDVAESVIVVRQIGGRLGKRITAGSVPLQAALGQEWIFALARPEHGWWTVYGITQGAFRVMEDRAVRDYRAYTFIGEPPASVRTGLESLPVAEIRGSAESAPPVEVTIKERAPPAPESTTERNPWPWIGLILLIAILVVGRRLRGAGLIVLLFLIYPLAGPAFIPFDWTPQSPTGASWNMVTQTPAAYFSGGEVEFRVVTAGNNAILSTDFQRAQEHAAQTWEDSPNATLAMTRGPNITSAPFDQDFSIAFTDMLDNTQWGQNMGGAAGLAIVSFFNGNLLNGDVCYEESLNWSVDGSTGLDLESVSVHEIGHAVGFGHTPHIQSSMSYVGTWDGIGFNEGNIYERRLTSDDHTGADFLYPVAGYGANHGTITGTITQGGPNMHKAQIGVFDSNGVLITTGLSNLGQYRIEGLDPGTYTLRAFQSFDWSVPSGLYQKSPNLTFTGSAESAFMTTSANDVIAVVTGGNTTNANIAVAAGTSSMRLTHTVRQGGFWFFQRSGIRLQRGETARIGVTGVNIPTSAGQLTEFTITGGGVTLTNVGFSGGANAPPNDNPYGGARSIVYDVTVAANANLGDRGLILRSSAFPTERYLTFGALEIIEDGSLTASVGPNNPPGSQIAASETDREMLQARLTAGSEPVRLRILNVLHSGTGSSANVSAVRFYHDVNGDGNLDGGDRLLASGGFVADNFTSPLVHTVPAGTSQDFLVVYDFTAGVLNGQTYITDLSTLTISGVDTAHGYGAIGLPVTGNTQGVEGTPPIAGTVADGLGADIDIQTSSTTISANWSGFSDPESGIAGYDWAIGTSPGALDVQGYVAVGLATNATNGALGLTDGVTYYVTVRATNGVGLQNAATSDGVLVDASAPVAGIANDGPVGPEIDFQVSTTTIEGNWSGFSDPHSGITGYEWAIGTSAFATDVQGFTAVGLATSAVNNGLALINGQIYHVTVRATNGSGLQTSASSDGVTVDTTAPFAGTVVDGLGVDVDWQSSITTISANWSGFSDPGSGIADYEMAIGTTFGGQEVQAFTSVGLVLNATVNGLSLTPGQIYFVTVRAINGVALPSTNATSDGVTVDNTAPVAGTVNDGPGADIDLQSSATTLQANWAGFADAESGIAFYEWAIGTTPGATNVQAFTGVGTSTSPTNSALALTQGQIYFVTVRANNAAGLTVTATSDGVTVDTTPPVAGTVNDGTAADIDFQVSTTTIDANWTGFADATSGVVDYEWSIGTSAGAQDVQAFVSVGLATSATNGALALAQGQIYFVTVRATNGAGLQTTVDSDGVTVDNTAPAAGTVNDGTGADIDLQFSLTTINANWSGFADAESGIADFEWAIGNAPLGTSEQGWTSVGTATSATNSGLTLTDGLTYFVSVRATNGSGLVSTEIASDGVTIDFTPPVGGAVNDGNAADIDVQLSTTSFWANWTAFNDPQTGIVDYQWAIGSTPGGTDVRPFVSVGLNLSANTSNIDAMLQLTPGSTYFVTIRGINGAGNNTDVSSDGVMITAVDAERPAFPTNMWVLPEDGQVTVEWLASASADVAFYRVWWKPSGASWETATLVDNILTTSTTIAGLANGSTFDFMLKAVDTSDNESFGVIRSQVPQPLIRIEGGGSFGTIQGAISAAGFGMTVVVGPGTFNEDLQLGPGVSLRGYSPRHTIVNGTGANPVLQTLGVFGLDPASTVENLTLAGGTDGLDAGDAELIVRRLIIHNMTANGITAGAAGRLSVFNVTVMSNAADGILSADIATIRNSIVGKSGGVGINVPVGSTVEYNNAYQNTGGDLASGVSGSGNHSGTAVFTDEVLFDFTVLTASPSVDRADPADPFASEPVPHGNRMNQGAYGNTAWAATSPPPPPPPPDDDDGSCGSVGLDLMLPLVLIAFFRRRRR